MPPASANWSGFAIGGSHRDRLSQTVNLTAQNAGNIGPESGVTYTLQIYGESGWAAGMDANLKRLGAVVGLPPLSG